MDLDSWLLKLNSWGFKDALSHPKTTVAFYVAFVVLRWLAIAAVIAVAVCTWMIVSIMASLFKSLR